jgi:transcriptional regulator with XRE-family HTH domain
MRDAVAERLGRNLRVARRRVGYSQAELGALCSLHRTEIGYIENGRRIPGAATLVKLVRVLEISADDLLRGIDWTVPAPTRPGSFAVQGSASPSPSRHAASTDHAESEGKLGRSAKLLPDSLR